MGMCITTAREPGHDRASCEAARPGAGATGRSPREPRETDRNEPPPTYKKHQEVGPRERNRQKEKNAIWEVLPIRIFTYGNAHLWECLPMGMLTYVTRNLYLWSCLPMGLGIFT